MSLVRYPVADSPHTALASPLGEAERASDAVRIAGCEIEFVSQDMGADFDTREAALTVWDQTLSVHMWCRLREVVVAAPGRRAALIALQPSNLNGRRWPSPPPPPRTVWRLNVSYWRPRRVQTDPLAPGGGLEGPQEGLTQARKARRDRSSDQLDAAALRAMAHQPLRAQRSQKGLDIGLFEIRAPEDPTRLIADE